MKHDGPHHHPHTQEEYDAVTLAVRDTVMSGVLTPYEDYGVVVERKRDGKLFVYVLPVPHAGGTFDAA